MRAVGKQVAPPDQPSAGENIGDTGEEGADHRLLDHELDQDQSEWSNAIDQK